MMGNQQHASVATIKKNLMTNSKSLIGIVVAALVLQMLMNIPQYTKHMTNKLQIKRSKCSTELGNPRDDLTQWCSRQRRSELSIPILGKKGHPSVGENKDRSLHRNGY